MLSFVLRRTLLRSGTLFSARRLLSCAISPNRPLTWPVHRGLATTSGDPNSESTADSQPESKPKSTGTKARSTKKVTGEEKTKGKTQRSEKKKTVAKQKTIIKPEHRPPKGPANTFALWLSDWSRTQPKPENRLAAQDLVRQAAQTWHTVPEHDKQRYREKSDVLRKEYDLRLEEWRERIDPAVLREMNRRRVAKGRPRIHGPQTGRPASGYLRYYQEVRVNTPRTEAQVNHRDEFKAWAKQAASQWKAMSEAEKAKYNDPAKADLEAWREKRKAGDHTKQ